ncbi:MAG: hypothetical protein IPK27_09875 [Rhodanobacteraceae bacterium]|nr:hypothetical protein [Rhodanobacteraceae bacterium]
MAYPLDEDFVAGIPAGFASAGGAGGVTPTWNEAAQAVDLVFSQAQNFWRIDAAEVVENFWFEIDAEVVAITYSSACFGFWLWTGSGTYEGHRLVAWQQQWHHSFWDAGGNQYELTAHAAAPWAVTGARRTIRVDAKRGNDGIWQYRLSDNDGIVVGRLQAAPRALPALHLRLRPDPARASGVWWRAEHPAGRAVSPLQGAASRSGAHPAGTGPGRAAALLAPRLPPFGWHA